jgi:phage terminase large subunit
VTRVRIPTIEPRPYQLPVFEYFDQDKPGLRAVDVWARRMGKDLCYMNVACMKAHDRKGLYVHFLPEAEHARRTIWDGFTNEGDRLIDVAFPKELRSGMDERGMRIELKCGSAWQLGGSDQYNRWVGSNPVGIVYSEFALAHPKGWELMRPILKMNGGWAAFISTPRGYNHLHTLLEIAKREPTWRWSHINALEVGLMTEADIAEEIRLGMPEELARQEYRCDFSAANVGAILGRYIEAAEREGRITIASPYDLAGAPLVVSSDIGFRDTASFWFWQRKPGGFALVDYDEDCGLDAEEWIERLRAKSWRIDTFYLPHDARAKTFQSRHSVVEQFLKSGLARTIKVVPAMRSQDKINAARSVLRRCEFDAAACAQGLLALREWSFKWSDERRAYSREPDHNWASHGADAFCYGAASLADFVPDKPVAPDPTTLAIPAAQFSLDQLFIDRERFGANRRSCT